MKLLFVYDHKYPDMWKDGLWRALKRLPFDVSMLNLRDGKEIQGAYDFVLGWGAFDSPVDHLLTSNSFKKKGLCIGGVVEPNAKTHQYDMLFFETQWFEDEIKEFPRTHAFGINEEVYKPINTPKVWDYICVGAFAGWKRLHYVAMKEGSSLVVGEIQRDNLDESMPIADYLISHGVGVMDMQKPETLALLYNMSRKAYIPTTVYGGGERAVLEARACSIPVEIESDNPKLQELLESPIYDSVYYASQLEKGIRQCLN